jgi:DNA primase
VGYQRNNEWERDFEVYTASQVEAVAEYCGIEIEGETNTHLLGFCPFHHNTDSPAFALDKTKGLWTCFNPSCANSGSLTTLLFRLKNLNPFEAKRIIMEKAGAESGVSRLQQLREQLAAPEFIPFPQEPVDRMVRDLWSPDGWKARAYLMDRGFESETLQYFGVGYSVKKDMSIVPMHDPDGMLVGFIGRSIQDKQFKNSDNLPKSKTAWNFHRAKRHGETVIVCESSFDAMRIHQAGYPNVVALLGGHFSELHKQQFDATFSRIIIMTDFDKRGNARPNCRRCANLPADEYGIRCIGHRPGRDLGHSIREALPNKRVFWAAYDDEVVYPHEAKDAGDMTDDEIRQCLKNCVSNLVYTRWDIENADLALAK